MVCCLTAPSYYLNQCWLHINELLWNSPDSNILCNEFENDIFEITGPSTTAQLVNNDEEQTPYTNKSMA